MVKGGYKQTEVGTIPVDWMILSGANITTLIGKGSSPTWQGFSYVDNGMLFVTSENVRDGFLDLSKSKYLPLLFHEKLKRTKLKKNDILINLVGASIGRSCIIKTELGEANINQAVALFRPSETCFPPYLASYLQSKLVVDRILGLQVDAARPNISLGNLRKFAIAVPPLPEQRAIAEALSDADALIAALDALIAKKRDLKQAAMQQLLTGKTRLPGFTGAWREPTIDEMFVFLRNGSNSRRDLSKNGEFAYLHYGDIHASSSAFMSYKEMEVSRIDAEKVGTLPRLRDGDLVIADASEDYDGIGKSVELVKIGTNRAVAGLHTLLLRGRQEYLADGFKGYLQFIPNFKFALIRIASGISVYGISKTNLKLITVKLPYPAEQSAIAAILSDMDTELAGLESQRDKARAIKQGMMQELLTGRIRLI